MDNNNYTRRPRKRITKEVARRRQLTALFVIAFIVLLIVVLIAKGCSKDKKKSGGSSNNNANITTTTTEPYVAPPEVTFTEPATIEEATKSAGGEFKMKKYTYSITVGESVTVWIEDNGYPAGVTEADERWSSSDENIAMVDVYGHVTGISKGECYVTVSAANDPSIESQVKIIVN